MIITCIVAWYALAFIVMSILTITALPPQTDDEWVEECWGFVLVWLFSPIILPCMLLMGMVAGGVWIFYNGMRYYMEWLYTLPDKCKTLLVKIIKE